MLRMQRTFAPARGPSAQIDFDFGRYEDKWVLYPFGWLPSADIKHRAVVDKIPWDVWEEDGHLFSTKTPTVDYVEVLNKLQEVYELGNLKWLAYDPWNKTSFSIVAKTLNLPHFIPEEVENDYSESIMRQQGQAAGKISPCLATFEREMLNKRLVHDGHPVLAYSLSQVRTITNTAGNRYPNKKDKGVITDVAQAAFNACGLIDKAIEAGLDETYADLYATSDTPLQTMYQDFFGA